MKIFVVRCIESDWNGEWITNDSVFNSEELALLRVQILSKGRPDICFDIQELILNE